MATSDACQPISDASSRSDWFRQTVLFWSSQNTNCESCSSEQGINDNLNSEMTSSELLSHFSSSESTSSLTLCSTQHEVNVNEGDYLLDLDHTTSELLKQVEEFEHCFSELTRKDAHILNDDTASIRTEDGRSETQSPHLTLEFPAGSSIRDSPLYKINTCTKDTENKMDCSAECTADDENVRLCIKNDNNDEEFKHSDVKCPAGIPNKNNADTEHTNMINSMENEGGGDIAKELDDRGDPNDVLRDLLCGIKPPDGKSVTTQAATPPPPQFTKQSPKIIHEKITINEKIDGKEKNIATTTTTATMDDEVFISGTSKARENEALLQQIDTLIHLEHQASRPMDSARLKKKSIKHNQEKIERLDSGLNGMSSDSNSPFPSPMIQQRSQTMSSTDCVRHKSPGYDSGYVEKQIRKNAETIYESTKETRDWNNFNADDSDLSSDWSPLSTMDSADFSVASSKRSRSYSVPHASQLSASTNNNNRRTSTGNLNSKKRANHSSGLTQSRFEGSSSEVAYSESELSAIRKFLTLTRKYFDKGIGGAGGVKQNGSLKELAMIPDMNEMIAAQNKEVKDQREMIEGFIRQLGDLLIEIVNLKDEQTAVRTKQAKALTLLKKQLDHHKKNQSQACNDILEQVNVLHEKLNSSLSTEQLTSTPVSKTGSVKSSSKSPSPSVKSVQNSKCNLTLTPPPHSTPSLSSLSPRTNNYGHIIWKIPDVMRKITRIKSGVLDGTLVSNPFQTGEYQYNMNAWVYLNGRGKMVGKYVSVYACVLVGEYDAILSWPVTPTYKFTLIDQRSDPTKRQDHVRYRRVLDIAGRGENVISQNGGIPRPTDGSKALIVGLDDFIAHDQLLKNRYLVDDVIFLKIEAEIN